MFPLSKIMDPQEDLPHLAAELAIINDARALDGQHELRAWEYGLALKAIRNWQAEVPLQSVCNPINPQLCDVGGAGSNFPRALRLLTMKDVWVVDPNMALGYPDGVPGLEPAKHTIEEVAASGIQFQFDAITCISVIEHVKQVPPFLRACHSLLKPGGLLFLTTDCWNCSGPDEAHFHWMRERIYSPDSIRKLQGTLREIGFKNFGASDWTYSGDHLFGSYSFASISMVKK